MQVHNLCRVHKSHMRKEIFALFLIARGLCRNADIGVSKKNKINLSLEGPKGLLLAAFTEARVIL